MSSMAIIIDLSFRSHQKFSVFIEMFGRCFNCTAEMACSCRFNNWRKGTNTLSGAKASTCKTMDSKILLSQVDIECFQIR